MNRAANAATRWLYELHLFKAGTAVAFETAVLAGSSGDATGLMTEAGSRNG